MSSATPRSRTSSSSLPAAPAQNVLAAARGGGITFTGMLFHYGVRLVIGIVVTRLLGSEKYGLYSLAQTAFEVVAGLALLGLTSALVRYISSFSSQEDAPGVWGALQVGVGVPTILSVLFGAGLCLAAGPIAERMFHEPELAPLLRLAGLAVPFLTLGQMLAAATRGFKSMRHTVIAQNISQPLIKLVLVAALAIAGLNATKALSAYIVSVIVTTVMLLYFLNSLFSLKRPLRAARHNTREMMKFALPLYVTDLINTFRSNIQTLLLGTMNTVTTVGIFSVASQVNLIGRAFHQSIVTVSMPIVSELYGRGEREPLARFYQTMSKWTFTLNLPVFLITLLFPGPILSIFGREFVEGATALLILAWGNLAVSSTGICGVVLDMTGNTVFTMANTIVLSVLTIGLNVLLIPRWGVVGAATATMVSVLLVNLLRIVEVYVLFRFLPYNRSFVKPVVAGLVAAAVSWAVLQVFHTKAHLIYTAMNALLLYAVYVGMIWLLGLSSEDRAVLARLYARLRTALAKN